MSETDPSPTRIALTPPMQDAPTHGPIKSGPTASGSIAIIAGDTEKAQQAKRDIEAGKNARMKTITARWGYLSERDKPENWQADAIIDHPREILQWI